MEILQQLVSGKSLESQEAGELMEKIMAGSLTPAQMGAVLVALKMKGETEAEIAAFATVMRENAVRIRPKMDGKGLLTDTCGTGGDSSGTFNVSTAAALIAAGAGTKIAKHGNRSVSSKSGSADVLEQLGVRLLQPAQVEKCIEKNGIGFMFAPYFHPAMKNIAPIRKELGIRTVFNILGPLANPAGVQAQVLGVFEPSMTEKMALALSSMGVQHALVVHSEGMDEIGLGSTKVTELSPQGLMSYYLSGEKLGFKNGKIPQAGSKEESAAIVKGVLEGRKGPARDISILNAAAAIYVGGGAPSLYDGIAIAEKSIDSGKALAKLNALAAFTGE